MARECLGQYQPEGECLHCTLALLCIDVAIEADGYYDRLAEQEEELWQLEMCAADARIQAAMENQPPISY